MDKTIINKLEAASEAHHEAFSSTNGVDEDWSLWYAQWLINDAEFVRCFDSHISESKLAYALLALDIDYTRLKPNQSWQEYYAEHIEHYLSQEASN